MAVTSMDDNNQENCGGSSSLHTIMRCGCNRDEQSRRRNDSGENHSFESNRSDPSSRWYANIIDWNDNIRFFFFFFKYHFYTYGEGRVFSNDLIEKHALNSRNYYAIWTKIWFELNDMNIMTIYGMNVYKYNRYLITTYIHIRILILDLSYSNITS